MLEPVMTLREGARMYAPGGSLLEAGGRLEQPGLVGALELVADEGARSVYRGTLAETLLELMHERGGLVDRSDLAAYTAVWGEPTPVRWRGRVVLTRGGLSGVPPVLQRLPALVELTPSARVVALVQALDGARGPETHTTNLVAVDAAGNACVLTTSLGLGSGDWLPGFDLHLNSMLGERDLVVGPLEPGTRMESMMAPTVALDDDGLELAIGAAGGTRLRTALVTVLAGILDESLAPQDAVERPRVHPADAVVNAEPGVDEEGLAALEDAGRAVRRWPEQHHYFGGVSAVARSGPAADPRRSGCAFAARPAG
jgi:gamma-glutamyltranspeptidase/glutathione hydrolase